jgi:hypothetical protein
MTVSAINYTQGASLTMLKQYRRIQALEAEVRQLTAQLAHAQQAVEEAFAAGQAEYRRRCEILEEDIRRRLVALLDGFKLNLPPAAPAPGSQTPAPGSFAPGSSAQTPARCERTSL